jgi:hypothetical protein
MPIIFGRGLCIDSVDRTLTLVASTDSVDRMPELSLRSRIPWTEHQNSRCVHGFRVPSPNARTLVAFTDSVDRMPELSLRSWIPWTECQKYRCVHGFREPNARSCHWDIASTDFMDSVFVSQFLALYSSWDKVKIRSSPKNER